MASRTYGTKYQWEVGIRSGCFKLVNFVRCACLLGGGKCRGEEVCDGSWNEVLGLFDNGFAVSVFSDRKLSLC